MAAGEALGVAFHRHHRLAAPQQLLVLHVTGATLPEIPASFCAAAPTTGRRRRSAADLERHDLVACVYKASTPAAHHFAVLPSLAERRGWLRADDHVHESAARIQFPAGRLFEIAAPPPEYRQGSRDVSHPVVLVFALARPLPSSDQPAAKVPR